MGFPGGAVVKNLPTHARDVGSIPGSGRSPGEGNGYLLQYSCLENSRERGAWQGGEGGESHSGSCNKLDTTELLSTHTRTWAAPRSPSTFQIALKPFKLYKVTLGLPWWSSG